MLSRLGPEGGILELRLSRPSRLNALTLQLTRELVAATREAEQDDAVRVLLLTGEGRGFCAGKDKDDPASAEFVAALQDLALALMNNPKPVVAAVQGWAVGAGVEMLLNCDIVVAASDARFMLPEVTIGLFATGGVAALLPRQAGLARAKGILMLGEAFSAHQALDWGLLWSVVEPPMLGESARAIAARLAGSDPAILAAIKSSLHRENFGNLSAVLAREAGVHAHLKETVRPAK
jgi:enoyl-CoA hydratase/carnithine racemase